MKRLIVLLLLALPMLADTGGVVPIGADGNWTTDGIFRNTTTHQITQKVGHITFTAPGFDPIVIEPTITLDAGETRRLVGMQQRFDAGKNYILPVESGVEASVLLKFLAGTTQQRAFEVGNVTANLTQIGSALDYVRVATSYTPPVGTWALVMNTNPSTIGLVLRVFGPLNGFNGTYSDEAVTVPAGISLVGVQHELKDGGSLRVCVGGCGFGTPGSVSPVYVFLTVGPPDGSTQGIRYALP